MRRMMGVVAATFSVLTLVGCQAERHLSASYGRSFRAAFAAQPVNPKGIPPSEQTALDSQEASAVAKAYRKSLAPAEARQDAPPVLLISPQDPRGAAPTSSTPK